MKRIYLLVMLLALKACSVDAQGLKPELLIIGDSLSSESTCQWPQYLRDDYYLKNLAQDGLKAVGFDFPDHLWMRENSKTIVYLGTNDAYQDADLDDFRVKYERIVHNLMQLNTDVYLIAPPVLNVYDILPYRRIVAQTALKYEASYIQLGWGAESTVGDGVHPQCWVHAIIAESIRQRIR